MTPTLFSRSLGDSLSLKIRAKRVGVIKIIDEKFTCNILMFFKAKFYSI